MKSPFNFPYVPFYPMGPASYEEFYNPSMSFRGQTSGAFGEMTPYPDLPMTQL
jgi:hypothetical protein